MPSDEAPSRGRLIGSISTATIITAAISVAAVRIVQEITGYATQAALGSFFADTRNTDLGPDGAAYVVLGEEARVDGVPGATPVTLYRCDSPGAETRAKAVFDAIAEAETFGPLNRVVIDAPKDTLAVFQGLTTIVYDASKGERAEVPALWSMMPDHEALQILPNAAEKEGWLLSLFVC